jgi:hypothetical protein
MKLPAYARPLLAALRAGKEPLHGIAVWIDRNPPARGICAPLAVFPDADPRELDWSVCKNRDVLIPRADAVDPARLIATCQAIRAAVPARLLLLKSDGGYEFVVSGGGHG